MVQQLREILRRKHDMLFLVQHDHIAGIVPDDARLQVQADLVVDLVLGGVCVPLVEPDVPQQRLRPVQQEGRDGHGVQCIPERDPL